VPFVRLKRRRGRAYGYLVENHWVAKAGQPRQHVLQYLGPADQIRLGDLPKEVRTVALATRLRQASESAEVRRATAREDLRRELRDALLAGHFPRARGTALRALRELGIAVLYGELIPEVFKDIGERWAEGSLSISREHLASGVAARVVEYVNTRIRPITPTSREVVLCVPEGENHTLALQLAEGLLLQKGLTPLNVGASAPLSSTLSFVRERQPAAALISVTVPSLLGSARTLALQIRRRAPGIPVFVGGQAVRSNPARASEEGIEFVPDSLPTFLKRWSLSESPRSRNRATDS
jgi:MerR family transcriptional regulator, light-induced transcriptional regulator